MKILRHLPWLLILVGGFAYFFFNTDTKVGDPDRFYHFALVRETAASDGPFLRTLPQVTGLNWNNYFPDKEFLFHQATLLGYHLGGDDGVAITAGIFAAGIFVLLYLIAAEFLSPLYAFFSALVAFGAPTLMFRLFLLRPHTLAIFTFLIMQWGILSRRPRLLFAGTALFALSYHAFYIVLVCLILSLAAGMIMRPRFWREHLKFHAWGLAGFAVGILLNPYFPSNLILGWRIANITALVTDPNVRLIFGDELYPVTSNLFVFRFRYPLILLVLSGMLWVRNWASRTQTLAADIHLSSLLTLGAFIVLATQTPRAGEYAIPASALAAIFIFREPFFKTRTGIALASLAFGFVAWHLLSSYKNEARFHNPALISAWLKAAEAVPAEGNPRVFNCEWDRTPYLFYRRPNARFLDLLDPSLFVYADRQKANLREILKRGYVPDPRKMLNELFQADYAYCYWPTVVEQMRRDPSFRQIFPKTADDVVPGYMTTHVFKVLRELPSQFVRHLKFREWTNATTTNFNRLEPASAKIGRGGERELYNAAYLNLGGELPIKDGAATLAHCASVSVIESELAKHSGARYLGLGGGRNLRVWRNGRPHYASQAAFDFTRSVQVLIPIPPLASTDRFEIAVCSSSGAPFWGVAVSFWKDADLDHLCKEKAYDRDPLAPKKSGNWPYGQVPRETCIAPIAPTQN